MDWFLYDRDFRHERVDALRLAHIHRDILLDYDKIKLLKRLTLEKHVKLT